MFNGHGTSALVGRECRVHAKCTDPHRRAKTFYGRTPCSNSNTGKHDPRRRRRSSAPEHVARKERRGAGAYSAPSTRQTLGTPHFSSRSQRLSHRALRPAGGTGEPNDSPGEDYEPPDAPSGATGRPAHVLVDPVPSPAVAKIELKSPRTSIDYDSNSDTIAHRRHAFATSRAVVRR